MAKFATQSPPSVNHLVALMNQPLAVAVKDGLGLLPFKFRLDKAHLGLSGGDHDRLSVRGLILLALNEGPTLLRRIRPHFMAESLQLARSEMRTLASLENHQRNRTTGHKGLNLLPGTLLAKPHLT